MFINSNWIVWSDIFSKTFSNPWYRRVGIWCLIFNLLYGTNSVTTIDWKTFLPYCSHKLITQYIQLRSSQPAFISANYFSRWLYNPTEKSRATFRTIRTWTWDIWVMCRTFMSCVTSCIVTMRNMMTNQWTDCLYFKVQIFNSFILLEFHHAETQCDSSSRGERRYNTTLSMPW